MEQLKRGVEVDGLTLPPGITLTRVDGIHESLKAKKDAIGKVCVFDIKSFRLRIIFVEFFALIFLVFFYFLAIKTITNS